MSAQAFSLPTLPGVRFVRHSIEEAPAKDGAIAFLDDGDDTGKRRRQAVGVWRNGAWTNDRGGALTFAPRYWTEIA